jgi:hypothetical protein
MDAEFIAIVRRRIASGDPYHEWDDVKYPELAVKWVQALDARIAEDDMLAHALVTPPAQLESADVIRTRQLRMDVRPASWADWLR